MSRRLPSGLKLKKLKQGITTNAIDPDNTPATQSITRVKLTYLETAIDYEDRKNKVDHFSISQEINGEV
jgi:hypothetical protein